MNNNRGLSLVEILVAVGILGIVSLGFLSVFDTQIKSTNFTDFKLRKVQLRNDLINQVLFESQNCGCLFAGADVIPAGASNFTLTGATPTAIGRYEFATPGDCSTATIPVPLVDSTGVEGVKSNSIELVKIFASGSAITGELLVKVEATKSVVGPNQSEVRVPVVIQSTPSGSDFQLTGCSALNVGGATPPAAALQGFCTNRVDWDNSGSMTCPDLAGYSKRKISGSYKFDFRSSACCYVPNDVGSQGWCSESMESWNTSFSGCGSDTANYQVVALQGVIYSTYDNTRCCFLPKQPTPGLVPVNSGKFACDYYWSQCPSNSSLSQYQVIEQNVVVGGSGRNCSCTFVPK